MMSDNTLETVLNLWKKDKVTLEKVKKLLNIDGEDIKWRQPQDSQPPTVIPWIQPADYQRGQVPFIYTSTTDPLDSLRGKITTVTLTA